MNELVVKRIRGTLYVCGILVLSYWAFISVYIGRPIPVTLVPIVTKALLAPEIEGTLREGTQEIHFVLPRHARLLEDSGTYKKYLSVTNQAKINEEYVPKTLHDSGWKFVEQFGSAYIFTNGDSTLHLSRRTLVRGIEIITFSLPQ